MTPYILRVNVKMIFLFYFFNKLGFNITLFLSVSLEKWLTISIPKVSQASS